MAKKLLFFLVALMPLIVMSSCSDDDDNGKGLAGSWRIQVGSEYIEWKFDGNGSGSLVENTDSHKSKATFNWKSDDSYIYLTNIAPVFGYDEDDLNEWDDSMKLAYRLDGNTLWLEDEEDSDELVPLKRQ